LPNKNKNTFKEITLEAFQKTVIEGKKPSILVFGAEWSGNAEIMNSMIGRISQEFTSEINFFEVDIEKHTSIASFFGVTSIPITIMLKEGEVLGLIKGFTSANNIRKKIKSNYSEATDNNDNRASR